MSRIKRGGYIIEWWVGDHWPRHVHILKDNRFIAKVAVPEIEPLYGRINNRIKKILKRLIKEKIL